MSGYILYRYRDDCPHCRELQPSWNMLRSYFPRSSWLQKESSTGTVPLFYIVTSNSEEEEVEGVRKALDNETPEKIVDALVKAMKEKLKKLPDDKKNIKETIQGILNSIETLKKTKDAARVIKTQEAQEHVAAVIGSSSGQDTPNPGGYNYGYGYT